MSAYWFKYELDLSFYWVAVEMIALGPLMTYLRHCQLAISYDDERQLTWPILYSLRPKLLWTDGKAGRASTPSALARWRSCGVSAGRAQ